MEGQYFQRLAEGFLKLRQQIGLLLSSVDRSRYTHLQNYIYLAHHPIFSFTESILFLCEKDKSRVAKVLLRTLFEMHINIIYHQLGNPEQRLAFSVKRMFDERIKILNEIMSLIKKYPNLESKDPKKLFNKEYLVKTINNQIANQKAILRANPNPEGVESLQGRARLCEEVEVKNAEKGGFERMYSLIYRQLSPVAHLNIEGLQEFIEQDEYGGIFFYDGNDRDFVATEAVKISVAFSKDLYDNKIIVGDQIAIIKEVEELTSRIGDKILNMKLLKTLNPEDASEEEIAKFETRTAARAIVYDDDGNVAVLHVSKQNYHKLAGGGVEEGEDIITALKRECLEELGCDIEVYGEVGEIIEYRKMFQLKQISPCYLARVVGEKGRPNFTQEEIGEGFEVMWIPIDDAIQLLASDKTEDKEGRLYIVPRDRTFLEVAKQSGVS